VQPFAKKIFEAVSEFKFNEDQVRVCARFFLWALKTLLVQACPLHWVEHACATVICWALDFSLLDHVHPSCWAHNA